MILDPHPGQNLAPELTELPQFGQKLADDADGAGADAGWGAMGCIIGWAGAPIKSFVEDNLK